MAATKIMIIRHAEKPADLGPPFGIDPDGNQDPEELIVQGWQRSGGLVRLFSPRDGKFVSDLLDTPKQIFADGIGPHSKSKRPSSTVGPLAALLGLQVDVTYLKGAESDLVPAVLAATGPVLICWQHEAIPAIGNAILGDVTMCPQVWPGDRFDVVWTFDRPSDTDPWTFNQVPQLLLAGDLSSIIAVV